MTHPEVSLVLQCRLIHPAHRASVFFNTSYVMVRLKLVWVMGTHLGLLYIDPQQVVREEDGWKLDAAQMECNLVQLLH